MWSSALTILASLVDTKYFRIALIAVACAFSAWLAYSYQSHRYEAQIADLRAQMAIQVAEQEKQNAEKLTKAIEERDSANSRLSALSASNASLLDRLRKQSSGSSATAESTGAKDSASEELARCRNLLLEGSRLLDEGCRLYGKCAADHDALVEIVK